MPRRPHRSGPRSRDRDRRELWRCHPGSARAAGLGNAAGATSSTATALAAVWRPIPYGLGSACLFGDPEYAQVGDGELRLIAKRLPPAHWCTKAYGLEYGGGGIQTQGGFAQQYGRFEIRAQMPPGSGFWPAFWLLPDDESFASEIDIVEMYGGRGNNADSTLHVPAAGPGPQHICPVTPDYSSAFHIYTMEWTPGSMRFLFDGKVCGEFTGMSADGTAPPGCPRRSILRTTSCWTSPCSRSGRPTPPPPSPVSCAWITSGCGSEQAATTGGTAERS